MPLRYLREGYSKDNAYARATANILQGSGITLTKMTTSTPYASGTFFPVDY